VHRHVNINEDDVLASSEQENLTRRLHMILLYEAVRKKICRVDVLWMSTGERVKVWFFCVM
jgi:hypothetical protein